MRAHRFSRRSFLARAGVLGAAMPVIAGGPASAAVGPVDGPIDQAAGPLSDAIVPILQDLAAETFAGVAAMCIPGPDPYSVQQGETDPGPGGVAARAHEFMIGAVDQYLPYPDGLLRPLAHQLATAADDAGLPPALADVTEAQAASLDAALGRVLANDQHVPLSTLFTLLLNHLASQADTAAALGGPFASPFANLPMAGKAEAFRLLESDQSDLVAMVDGDLDEASKRSLSGLLKFVGNALITFVTFGTFSEFSGVDPETGTVTSRPVGWDIANFTPGEMVPADGWDEYRGYWAGRRRADGVRTWPRGPRALTIEETDDA